MPEVIDWLLEGDPSVRWQTERDLLGAPSDRYTKEQKRVASDGWGTALLKRQDRDGNWGGGIYGPKWISTTYTLLLLRQLGLPQDNAQARGGCENFFARGLERDGGINLFKSFRHSETCVNGMLLGLLSYFRSQDPRIASVVQFLLDEQMPDGGWNCERVRGAHHGSFHTTISVLEGLREFAAGLAGTSAQLEAAVRAGHEFLWRHRLYRSHRTGRIVDPEMLRMHFPPQWHYDVIRALDYFQSVRAPRDPRMQGAIQLIESRRTAGGKWNLNASWKGRVFFELEQTGQPSRWNTLRAMRILNWWAQKPSPRSVRDEGAMRASESSPKRTAR